MSNAAVVEQIRASFNDPKRPSVASCLGSSRYRELRLLTGRRVEPRPWEVSGHLFYQFPYFNGFRDESIAPSSNRFLFVFLHGICRQTYDWNSAGGAVCFQNPSCVETVHAREP